MWYDTNIINSFNKSNENEFQIDDKVFYKTKTGITKMKQGNEKAIKISEIEYTNAWEKWKDIFQ